MMKVTPEMLGVLDRIERLLKHLPGQHSQLTHGSGGAMLAPDTGAQLAGGSGGGSGAVTAGRGEITMEEVGKAADRVIENASAEELVEGLKGLGPDLRPMVTIYKPEEYREWNSTIRMSKDRKSGYAVKEDGELISVFSVEHGTGRGHELMLDAIDHGADHLDCFDTTLPGFYKKHGFVETGRDKWVDKWAPKGWNYKKFGKPDIVYMSRKSETKKRWRPAWREKRPLS